MATEELPSDARPTEYVHGGARALVTLHERYLSEFLLVWRQFVAAGCALPATSDPDYASAQTLLRHVLGAARGYLVWTCEKLGLPDPGITPTPDADNIAAAADEYTRHLIERWREPLKTLSHEQCDRATFESSWGVPYCIDAMLEHAVMHPIRHTLQLQQLLAADRRASGTPE
ncbi:MAG: hypothetical protein AAF581_08545 [Planctomycetota bacterium]